MTLWGSYQLVDYDSASSVILRSVCVRNHGRFLRWIVSLSIARGGKLRIHMHAALANPTKEPVPQRYRYGSNYNADWYAHTKSGRERKPTNVTIGIRWYITAWQANQHWLMISSLVIAEASFSNRNRCSSSALWYFSSKNDLLAHLFPSDLCTGASIFHMFLSLYLKGSKKPCDSALLLVQHFSLIYFLQKLASCCHPANRNKKRGQNPHIEQISSYSFRSWVMNCELRSTSKYVITTHDWLPTTELYETGLAHVCALSILSCRNQILTHYCRRKSCMKQIFTHDSRTLSYEI